MPLLFSVVDSPRHPNLTALYQRLGIEEVRLDSQRKAIAQLKKQQPDIIVADFVYAFSTYYQATNISNLDVLLSSLVKYGSTAKVIVLVDKGELQHVAQLNAIYPLYGIVQLPVKESELAALLQEALTARNKQRAD
ncbi:MAG TPA: hypothetical protein VGE50_11650 [Gammaproteobacteria bacterium]